MIRTIFILILALMPQIGMTAEKFPEPFGLTWNMTETDLRGIGFSPATDDGDLSILTSVSAPKAWSKAESYFAVTYKGKLVKAGATSVNFTNDIYGSEGKAEFARLKALLTKKYGAPQSSYERIGGKLYDEADEFYQCLEYAGCGAYLATFEMVGGLIGLQLEGKRRGEGYIRLLYESPEFSIAKAKIEQGNLSSDEDSL